jgi:hypothetical protein
VAVAIREKAGLRQREAAGFGAATTVGGKSVPAPPS